MELKVYSQKLQTHTHKCHRLSVLRTPRFEHPPLRASCAKALQLSSRAIPRRPSAVPEWFQAALLLAWSPWEQHIVKRLIEGAWEEAGD